MSVTIVGPRTATVITSAPFCPHPIVAVNQTSVANIVWYRFVTSNMDPFPISYHLSHPIVVNKNIVWDPPWFAFCYNQYGSIVEDHSW